MVGTMSKGGDTGDKAPVPTRRIEELDAVRAATALSFLHSVTFAASDLTQAEIRAGMIEYDRLFPPPDGNQ